MTSLSSLMSQQIGYCVSLRATHSFLADVLQPVTELTQGVDRGVEPVPATDKLGRNCAAAASALLPLLAIHGIYRHHRVTRLAH